MKNKATSCLHPIEYNSFNKPFVDILCLICLWIRSLDFPLNFLCHGLTTTYLHKPKSQESPLDPPSLSLFFSIFNIQEEQVSLTLPPKQIPSLLTPCKFQIHPDTCGLQSPTRHVLCLPLYPYFLSLLCSFTLFQPHATQLCQAYSCLRTFAFVWSVLKSLPRDLANLAFFSLVSSLLKCSLLREALPDCYF